MTNAVAIIRWMPPSRGGRSQPPNDANSFSTVARFESDVLRSHGAWSVRLSDIKRLARADCIQAKIEFLVKDAPAHLMNEGERFELLEGERVIAKAVVIPTTLAVPSSISDFDVALLG